MFVLMFCRCDLSIALLANSDPVFYHQPEELLPQYPEEVISSFKSSIHSGEMVQFMHDMNRELAEVWSVMKKFCLLANLGTQTQMLLQPATIYGTMTAV